MSAPPALRGRAAEVILSTPFGKHQRQFPGSVDTALQIVDALYAAGLLGADDTAADRDRQNDGEPVTEHLYAWLAEDGDGIEGVVTAELPSLGTVPLVMTDRARAERFTGIARLGSIARGNPARLVEFHRGRTLRTVTEAR